MRVREGVAVADGEPVERVCQDRVRLSVQVPLRLRVCVGTPLGVREGVREGGEGLREAVAVPERVALVPEALRDPEGGERVKDRVGAKVTVTEAVREREGVWLGLGDPEAGERVRVAVGDARGVGLRDADAVAVPLGLRERVRGAVSEGEAEGECVPVGVSVVSEWEGEGLGVPRERLGLGVGVGERLGLALCTADRETVVDADWLAVVVAVRDGVRVLTVPKVWDGEGLGLWVPVGLGVRLPLPVPEAVLVRDSVGAQVRVALRDAVLGVARVADGDGVGVPLREAVGERVALEGVKALPLRLTDGGLTVAEVAVAVVVGVAVWLRVGGLGVRVAVGVSKEVQDRVGVGEAVGVERVQEALKEAEGPE